MKRFKHSLYVILILVTALSLVATVVSAAGGRTYTLNADFDEGTLISVEHDTVPDQLQLSGEVDTLPFIWVPNQNGTVSKVNTETGKELGRYIVAPHTNSAPSRTTVDLQGNCWVGQRQAGTVVKIGLYEAGNWIDRNGNGVADTSQDLNNDGDITGGEILPWGQDECVLFEVVLILGSEGTWVPGTFPGPYDMNYWGTAPRGLAIDALGNCWAGTWSSQRFYYIDGSTGTILKTTGPYSIPSYGAVIDGNGILWSSRGNHNQVMRLDVSTNPPTASYITVSGQYVYGIGLDFTNHLFASGWTTSRLARINTTTAVLDWIKAGPYTGRGVVCTPDGDVWVASTNDDRVYRYDNNGTFKAQIWVNAHGGGGPTGVALDAAGKVWACNLDDEYVARIDPATNSVDLYKQIVGSGGHYSYSDMTGIIARTITTQIGTWTVDYDSGVAGTGWGIVSWNGSEPAGTSISVRVRSSEDGSSWSGWETATDGALLGSTPNGRYLQVETTLQILSGDVSPILYDLTVQPLGNGNGPGPVPSVPGITGLGLIAATLILGALIPLAIRRRVLSMRKQ
jgi:streptogramin lyase